MKENTASRALLQPATLPLIMWCMVHKNTAFFEVRKEIRL